MATPDLVELFVRPLSALGIRHMVSGSVAAMLFGEPRLTLDIDIVVFLSDADIPRLSTVFTVPEFYLPPEDVIRIEARRDRRGHFNVIHTTSGLKADFYLSNRDALHNWAIDRVRILDVGGVDVSVAPPEYVILRKLEYYREGGSEKHVRDIRAMLDLSAHQLDQEALGMWLDRLRLTAEWSMVAGGRAGKKD